MYSRAIMQDEGLADIGRSVSLSGLSAPHHRSLSVVGVFAGIGGIEKGFQTEGHESILFCEADQAARLVLSCRFPGVDLSDDVRKLGALPTCDVVTAGFPCQDLSQAGRLRGIAGPNSGLIDVLLNLLEKARPRPEWVVLENVPFMLKLDRGRAVEQIVTRLEHLGYAWAYRTVDARAFGLPQRRRRVVILASRHGDPRLPLLGVDGGPPPNPKRSSHACGFYWTEGNTGLGWAVDATPPLKGGSGLHIPSPPALWFPRRRLIAVPSIEDAERLQGFPPGWTSMSDGDERIARQRWRLVGNAVSVPLAKWIASRLRVFGDYDDLADLELKLGARWPSAAWGVAGRRGASRVSEWPIVEEQKHLASFLSQQPKPLSRKATAGFLSRLERSTLRAKPEFLADLRHHITRHDNEEFTRSQNTQRENTRRS
jgi:DNA (cytosine-5)-methyltransferase 1